MYVLRRTKSILTFLLVAVFLVGCDSTDALRNDSDGATTTQDVDATVKAVTETLELSEAQQDNLRTIIERYKERRDEPGVLWRASADLQETLTAEQKAKLAERMTEARAHWGDRDHTKRPHHRKHRRGHRGKHFRGLNLTEEQKEQAKQLREQRRAAFEALREQREQGELSDEAFREQMRALHEEAREDFMALLTDEQKAQLAEKREQHEARRGKHKERREEARAVRAEVLDLTDEQKEAFRQLHEEHRAAFEDLRERTHSDSLDREAMRDAFREHRQERREQAAAILNERQEEITMIHRPLAFRLMKRRATHKRHHR